MVGAFAALALQHVPVSITMLALHILEYPVVEEQ